MDSHCVLPHAQMPYPRVCAHRGMNTVAPENSMPAWGAAIALGAQEIEFDLWPTLDGEIVSCHDATLDRVSNGTGKVYEKTYDELKNLDFGAKFSPAFQGLRIVRFEDILKKFARHAIMNVHIKTLGPDYPAAAMARIVDLVRQYQCQEHVYFMIAQDEVARQFMAYAPQIAICVGHRMDQPWTIVDRAIALGAKQVQLFKPYFNQEMVDKAHAHGVKCNVFFADDPQEALQYRAMGIDCVLTNDYHRIAQALQEGGAL